MRLGCIRPDRRECIRRLPLLTAASDKRAVTRRAQSATVLATLALGAAAVAAIGPARSDHAEYTWPPRAPSQSTRGAYAPLPLLNRVPASLDFVLSCGRSPRKAGLQPKLAFATARNPSEAEGLEVTLRPTSVHVGVGDVEYATAPWPAACPYRVHIAGGVLQTSTGSSTELRTSAPDNMPVVTGLFTKLDLTAEDYLRVSVRTRDYATSQTTRQIIASVFALTLVTITLLLLGLDGARFSQRASVGDRLRSAWARRHPTDAVVVTTLAVWWIVAPPIVDDGWIWLQHRLFGDLGTINQYYEMWGVNFPLGFWVDMLRHPVLGAANDILILRVPALLVLIGIWGACRWCLDASMPSPIPRVSRWALAGAFLAGAMAWGMTLRFEPFTSVLTTLVLISTLSFVRQPRIAPMLIALPLVALAFTAHPAGVVSLAPVLAAAPNIVRWLRTGTREVLAAGVSLLVASVALALTLFSLDADVRTRLEDGRIIRGIETHSGPLWNEYERYAMIDGGVGVAIRNLSVVVLLFTVAAFVSRLPRSAALVSILPARTVAVALLLLVLVPTKWPWHFGALLGIGAVGAACEIARLAEEQRSTEGVPLRALAALALTPLAAYWVWSASGPWGFLDTGKWDAMFTPATLLITLALILVVAAADRRWAFDQAILGTPARLRACATWALPTLAFCTIGLSLVVLVEAMGREPWNLGRQNLGTLLGRDDCVLAEDLPGAKLRDADTAVLVPSPLVPYLPCFRNPRIVAGTIEMPRMVIRHQLDYPLDRPDSPFYALNDLYEIRSLGHGPREVEVKLVGNEIPGFERLDAVRRRTAASP
jgi:hypothetical protein